MPRSTGRVDAVQAAIVAALRGVGCDCWLTHTAGKGAPDLVVWSPHTKRTHLIETKERTGTLTPAQRRFHATWGGPIAIVRSVEGALRVVGAVADGEGDGQ